MRDNFKESHDVKEDEYKGKATIGIPITESKDGEVFYMTFGLKKAQRIVEYIEEITEWIIRQEGGR